MTFLKLTGRRGCHRFFLGDDDEIYVADDSGNTPAFTDDGPLRFIGDEVFTEAGGYVCPVMRPDGRRSYVTLTEVGAQSLKDAHRLAKKPPLTIAQ